MTDSEDAPERIGFNHSSTAELDSTIREITASEDGHYNYLREDLAMNRSEVEETVREALFELGKVPANVTSLPRETKRQIAEAEEKLESLLDEEETHG